MRFSCGEIGHTIMTWLYYSSLKAPLTAQLP
jgi:hypothetical protein